MDFRVIGDNYISKETDTQDTQITSSAIARTSNAFYLDNGASPQARYSHINAMRR